MSVKILQDLYIGVLLTLTIMVVARNYRVSVWFYVIHSILLDFIFIWYGYALGNKVFYLWSVSTFITRVIIIPFATGGMFYTIRKIYPEETKPIVTFGPSIFFISTLMVVTWKLFHIYIDFFAPIPSAAEEPSRTNLAIAFTIFTLGIYTLLTRRDAIKTVMGLAIMENGIHLTLVDLAPQLSETVILGILTNVVASVFILLYFSRCIYLQLGVRDTVKLSELRY